MNVAEYFQKVKENGRYRRRAAWPADWLSQSRAARMLGVHRVHLNKVLRGAKASRSLNRRYRALVREWKRNLR